MASPRTLLFSAAVLLTSGFAAAEVSCVTGGGLGLALRQFMMARADASALVDVA